MVVRKGNSGGTDNFFSSQMNFDFEEDLRRELVGEFYEHVRQEVEQTIRKEVEAEMWGQFEQINRDRHNQTE